MCSSLVSSFICFQLWLLVPPLLQPPLELLKQSNGWVSQSIAYGLILENAEPLTSPRSMFICIYLCNIMDPSASQTQQKKPFVKTSTLRGSPYLHAQLHFVLADRGICWGPGGHTRQEKSRTGCPQRRPASRRPSSPPSFFPLNCNPPPPLPLCFDVNVCDDALSLSRCAISKSWPVNEKERMAKKGNDVSTLILQCSWKAEISGLKSHSFILKSSNLNHFQPVLASRNQLATFNLCWKQEKTAASNTEEDQE